MKGKVTSDGESEKKWPERKPEESEERGELCQPALSTSSAEAATHIIISSLILINIHHYHHVFAKIINMSSYGFICITYKSDDIRIRSSPHKS